MAYFVATLEDILGVREEKNEGSPRLSTDEGGTMLGLAGVPHGDSTPTTLAADEGGMKRASPSRPWPVELTAMNIPDLPDLHPPLQERTLRRRRRDHRLCAAATTATPMRGG